MEQPYSVDVVIPNYNRVELVERAIISALGQTYRPSTVIVVDDASETEMSRDVVKNYEDAELLVSSTRRGASAARNMGWRYSNADLVAFMDSDDEWLSKKLEWQVDAYVGANEESIGLIYTGELTIVDGEVVGRRPAITHEDIYQELLLENVIGGTSVALMPREVLKSTGGFDESLPARQDVDLWVRVARRYEVVAVQKCLARLDRSKNRRGISRNARKVVVGHLRYAAKHANEIQTNGLVEEFLTTNAGKFQGHDQLQRLGTAYAALALVASPVNWRALLSLCVSVAPRSLIELTRRIRRMYD